LFAALVVKCIAAYNVYMVCFLQDGAPNERKIVKLCEYAAKNPLRIPKACDVAIL
jgi:hypothetical protein